MPEAGPIAPIADELLDAGKQLHSDAANAYHKLATISARSFAPGPVLAAEVVVSEIQARRALFNLVQRLSERLEARILGGQTNKSTEAAMAKVLLECVDRLDRMQERMNEKKPLGDAAQVEHILTRMNELTADLARLRAPGRKPSEATEVTVLPSEDTSKTDSSSSSPAS